MKSGTALAIILFCLVALAHLLRLVLGVEVTVEDWRVPIWVSAPGVVIPAVIALVLYRESR